MTRSQVDAIIARIRKLQSELEVEVERLLKEKREQFHYNLERGRVRFEEGIKSLQKRQKTGLWQYLRETRLRHLLTAPIIYSVFFPFLLLDIFVTIYQKICFPVYGVKTVRRRDYLVVDRQHLAYLNSIEKFHCMYCGYGNGVVEYVREVTARTEQYWCPIKHAKRTPDPHRLTDNFVDYGDAEAYKEKLDKLQADLSTIEDEKKLKQKAKDEQTACP